MLILTRKKDESIIIDDNIKIKIISLDNNRVQLGIEAPRSVSIHRKEIYEEIQQENKMAVYNKENMTKDLSNMLKNKAKRGKNGEK